MHWKYPDVILQNDGSTYFFDVLIKIWLSPVFEISFLTVPSQRVLVY